jgi:hypothetical protein
MGLTSNRLIFPDYREQETKPRKHNTQTNDLAVQYAIMNTATAENTQSLLSTGAPIVEDSF